MRRFTDEYAGRASGYKKGAQQAPGFFGVLTWNQKHDCAHSLAVQRDFEGIFRIWEGKSSHRQKYTCIHSTRYENNLACGSLRRVKKTGGFNFETGYRIIHRFMGIVSALAVSPSGGGARV